MATNPAYFHAKGDTIPYTPGSAVAAGDVVVDNNRVYVAPVAIAAGELGALTATGVARFPKKTGAITRGDRVFWDPAGNPNSAAGGANGAGAATTSGAGAYLAGVAQADAASGDDFVPVKLSTEHTPRVGVAAVAAAGSVQGDAAALSEGLNVVTGADGTKGVILPAAVPGMLVRVKNNAGSALKVYPGTAGVINAIAANGAISMAANTPAEFYASGTGQWWSFPLLPS